MHSFKIQTQNRINFVEVSSILIRIPKVILTYIVLTTWQEKTIKSHDNDLDFHFPPFFKLSNMDNF